MGAEKIEVEASKTAQEMTNAVATFLPQQNGESKICL